MAKVKTTRNRAASLHRREVAQSEEVSDLVKVLQAIEEVGHKAGCMLVANKSDLAGQEISLLEDMQVLGARAEYLMLERIRPERAKAPEFLISKNLSKTDVECQLTLTSVEGKLEDLCAVWGQHGQVLGVTDLIDHEDMEFTFVIWLHNKGRRAVLTGGWKRFCRKHDLKVGDEISIAISHDSSNKYILRARERMDPLAVLECKDLSVQSRAVVWQEKACPASGDGEAARVGEASRTCPLVSGEGQDCEDTQGAAASGESRNLAILEDEKTAQIAEDEKVAELAEYLFRLSRWASPFKNPHKS